MREVVTSELIEVLELALLPESLVFAVEAAARVELPVLLVLPLTEVPLLSLFLFEEELLREPEVFEPPAEPME